MKIPERKIKKFWSKVQKGSEDECWPFIGSRLSKGYGYMSLGKRNSSEYAHRIAWILQNGAIPPGLCVCHRCDNPPCCNPSHLFLGTLGDNNRDAKRKGRSKHMVMFGESHPRTTLTRNQVEEIKRRHKPGKAPQRGGENSTRALAEEFGVSHSSIGQIVRGKRWIGSDKKFVRTIPIDSEGQE